MERREIFTLKILIINNCINVSVYINFYFTFIYEAYDLFVSMLFVLEILLSMYQD